MCPSSTARDGATPPRPLAIRCSIAARLATARPVLRALLAC